MKSRHYLYSIPVIVLLTGCNFTLAADVTPPPGYQQQQVVAEQTATPSEQLFPLVPPDLLQGEKIYVEKCTPCHGDKGLGDGFRAQDLPKPVIPLGSAEIARQAIPAEWFRIVTQGNIEKFMPPFSSLTDRQRWDVVAYTLALNEIPQDFEAGKQIFLEFCAGCHGLSGQGDGPDVSGLNMPDLTRQDYQAGNSAEDFFTAIQDGSPPTMPPFGEVLSEAEIWTLTGYIRSLGYLSDSSKAAVSGFKESGNSPTQAVSTPSIQETESEENELITISGLVTNGSGGPIPVNVDVMLHAFDQMQLVYTATAQLDKDGVFEFKGQNRSSVQSFLATIDYEGVIYSSELGKADENQNMLDLPIQIFDSVADPSILKVDRLHYFFELIDSNTMRIVELYIISNPTTNTLMAPQDGQPLVEFKLPAGAENLEIQDGELGKRFILTENGLGDTTPIYPGSGSYQVLFSYTLPYDRKLEFSNQISMDTDALVILVPEDLIQVKGDGIRDSGTRDVQGVPYHMYNGSNYQQGDQISLEVTARPSDLLPSPSLGSNQNLVIGFGALGIVFIIVGLWMFQRNRSTNASKLDTEMVEEDDDESVETILDAILALDDLFQAGKLPEGAYLERRGELKTRLKNLQDNQEKSE